MNSKYCFHIAPMLGYTDRHFRVLLRLISRHCLLYTEMISSQALLNSDNNKILSLNSVEPPIVIQLADYDPRYLVMCSKLAKDYGYDKINLNVGCPSHRVKAGGFGACLFLQPRVVAKCINAIRKESGAQVSVKTRLGVTKNSCYEDLINFVDIVSEAGCKEFILHARKAYLDHLNPKENRNVPPLQYEVVYRLKTDRPYLRIILNGGIQNLVAAKRHLDFVDGVMLGRAICKNPYMLATLDRDFFSDPHDVPSRYEIVKCYLEYVANNLVENIPLRCMLRHLLNLYYGVPGARQWRRYLSSFCDRFSLKKDADSKVIISHFSDILGKAANLHIL